MSDRNAEGVAWDNDDARTQGCTLATAVSRSDVIVLNFGARDGDDLHAQAFNPKRLRSIALRPASAKHLRDMLAGLMAERGS
ncbi:MAG: hypothetical protein AB7F35_28380 [Acetobacteraceae bacterium]